MKKLAILLLCFTFINCGDKKETPSDASSTTPKTAEKLDGKALFNDKTCVACHALDQKIIGPSIKEMVKVYEEKKGNFVQFLKGNADPIVDLTPGNVAIMKANLTGILKDATADELQALATYMREVGK